VCIMHHASCARRCSHLSPSPLCLDDFNRTGSSCRWVGERQSAWIEVELAKLSHLYGVSLTAR
jgi:hypothetical protein